MHDVDLADALDRGRPVILLFATPALCESRVCGPVTDVAEQVKAEYGDRADFIHMEIYNDNDPNKGQRPQVRAWGLQTEPVLFAIDRRGRVVDRLDGAYSVSELERGRAQGAALSGFERGVLLGVAALIVARRRARPPGAGSRPSAGSSDERAARAALTPRRRRADRAPRRAAAWPEVRASGAAAVRGP